MHLVTQVKTTMAAAGSVVEQLAGQISLKTARPLIGRCWAVTFARKSRPFESGVPMMFRASIVLIGAAVGFFISFQELPAAEKRPNVVFVLTDDQRWDTISLNERSAIKTPHIDRLGKEGVYFRNAFCTTSLCSPSRASILSGLYAHSHGVLNNFTEYPVDLPSFPRQLQAAGYTTAYIGKYHMGEENDEKRPGFDYFVTHKGQGKYFDTEFNVDGQRQVLPGYYTHVVTDLAEKWIRGAAKGDKPFLMMLGHKAPHSFYFPEPKYEHAFDDVKVEYPP